MVNVKVGGAAVAIAALLLTACSDKAAVTEKEKSVAAKVETTTPSTPAAPSFSPYVDSNGNISRPTDFLTNPDWTHLGAWGVVNLNGEGNGMHNVYTTLDAVKSYRQTGKFPDGAVLVKEVRGASNADLMTGSAYWAADKAVWFVSVKDATNRFPNNPLWGDGWGWALFEAGAPAKQVAKDYKEDCLSCHVPVKDTDWMYVHAYPVLQNN